MRKESVVKLLVLLALGWMLGLRAAGAADLQVTNQPSVNLWPGVTLLSDPGHSFKVDDLIDHPERFSAPTGTPGNLGRRDDTVWLRIPLNVAGIDSVDRVLDIDYPPLNRVDVYLLRGSRVMSEHRLGNELMLADRPMPTRTHALTLNLLPGEQTLLLRVRSTSSMLLPLTLRTDADMLLKESKEHLAQGLIFGLALCMVLYSMTHWIGLRDHTFLAYTVLVVSNVVFVGSYFGITGLYVWPDWPALSMAISPLAVLTAVIAGTVFIRGTLNLREVSTALDRTMLAIRWTAAAGLALGVLGVLPYTKAQLLATVLGVTVTVVVIPVGVLRTLRGDRVAAYMLLGWMFYIVGAVSLALLLRGYVEPGPYALYGYPASMMVEMAAWMAVLSERVQAVHRNATRERIERDTLRAMAHTDALTGLPNRRGLQERLAAELERSSPQRLLAVYLLDLDGFKPVNDRYGHDVGDALLIAVGQRLSAQLRGTDVVARLGGDEFVVLAAGLADEGTARMLGTKMLQAFEEPFVAAGQTCRVGLTIGYALAPQDAGEAEELLKRADAAMYAGKEAGRHQVVRGGRKSAAAAV